MITEEKLKEWSSRFGMTIRTSLEDAEWVRMKAPVMPYAFVKKKGILPLERQDGKVIVAVSNPLDLEVLEEIQLFLGEEVEEVLSSQKEIEEAIEKSYQQDQEKASHLIAEAHLNNENSGESFEAEEYDLLDAKADSPVIEILNAVLLQAIQQGASDIHLEPLQTGLQIRYRIDGVLQIKASPPKDLQSQLLTRVKVLSRLDIAEQRLPQDGRLKLRMGGRHIDFRVSTIPCVFGERIVLRILDQSNVLLGLDRIGMRDDLLRSFRSLIHFPEGIVLVTGPTGSGKTTTLYSALSEINSSGVNIMTIEDPVEYKLPGMAQMGVNTKINLSFSTGLRHILRQDPDVIMIGEIRDKETAEIAIQASLTGHLVLSTLHTNDAPSAVTRLIDMGIEPYLLTSSIIGVVAQRLVRCLCVHCKQPYTPSERELYDLQVLPEEAALHRFLYRPVGCEHCYGSGYRGRHGIYEIMPVTAPLKEQLLHSVDAHRLKEIALAQGMSVLRREGAILALEGVTSSEEVLRVTRGCEGV